MSGRKARGLGSGKSTGSASHAARQRNLKQKFVSLLKKFKVTDPEELDQENVDQKLSGNTHYIVYLHKVKLNMYEPFASVWSKIGVFWAGKTYT